MAATIGVQPSSLNPIITHLVEKLSQHRVLETERKVERPSPLFVAFQGPQGSGKTFLTSLLQTYLENSSCGSLNVAVLSIDDLYLTHSELDDLATRNPGNLLLSGRGQPGTHDVALGVQLLSKLKAVNRIVEEEPIQIPFFDKSLFDSEGDRVEDCTNIVLAPIDIVVLEGWCVGFHPLSSRSLERKYKSFVEDLAERDSGMMEKSGILANSTPTFSIEHIKQVNDLLWKYLDWWSFFDVFIQISPPDYAPYSIIYKWRLQQEHAMKARNGGKGMTDEQVKTFIDRYIPGYVFFGDGIQNGYVDEEGSTVKLPKWRGNGLKIILDEDRVLVETHLF